MLDCPNADVRDQLPDLVSGALSGPNRAVVQAHVDACAECRAEVALISRARAAIIAGTPPTGVAQIRSIVAALPTPTGTSVGRIPAAKGRSNQLVWRIAATVIFVVGSTVVLQQAVRRGVPRPDSSAIRETQAAVAGSTSAELALPTSVDSLSTEQLKSLLSKIDHLDGLPPAAPDVNDPGSGGGSERLDSLELGSRTAR